MTMDKIHIWMGNVNYSKQEYWNYFDQSNANLIGENGLERNESDLTYSNFSKDLGKDEMFNPDFIGYYFNEESNNIDLALEQLPDPDLPLIIKEDCIKKGVDKANAMFYYTDESLIINENKLYNGLTYIGCYDWEV